MYSLLNLLHHEGIDVWRTCSVLGYCLLPVIYLATISIFISLRGLIGLSLSIIAISWSTYSSIRLFDAKLNLQITEQYWLVVYPIMLLYSCFVLITVFIIMCNLILCNPNDSFERNYKLLPKC